MNRQELIEVLGTLLDVAALGPDGDLKAVVKKQKRHNMIELKVYDWRQQGVWSDIRKALGIPFDLTKVGK